MVIVRMKRQKEAELVATERRSMKSRRRLWVKKWLLRRASLDTMNDKLMVELGAEDQSSFRNLIAVITIKKPRENRLLFCHAF